VYRTKKLTILMDSIVRIRTLSALEKILNGRSDISSGYKFQHQNDAKDERKLSLHRVGGVERNKMILVAAEH
jgi:hypothetical protein